MDSEVQPSLPMNEEYLQYLRNTYGDCTVEATDNIVARADFQKLQQRIEQGKVWSAGVIVADSQAQTLLQRGDWSQQWHPPGGSVRQGEFPDEGARRTVLDETGIEVEIRELLILNRVTWHCENEKAEQNALVFRAQALSDTPPMPGAGVKEVGWFKELPKETLDREFVEQYRSS